jgi:DNA-binding transcriptional MerR regulator
MTESYERSGSRWAESSGTADSYARIPQDKKYFRIGEVSRIIGVEPYVLRYWEGEFPQIRPARADSNQRTYQRKDLEMLLDIKRLLYEEGLTIQGAKKRLKERPSSPDRAGLSPDGVDEVRRALREVLRILS